MPRPEDISSAQAMRLIPCRLKILRLPSSLLPPASQLFSSLLDQISSIYIFSNTSHIKTIIAHLTLHPLQLPPHFLFLFGGKLPESLVKICSLFLPFSTESAPIRFCLPYSTPTCCQGQWSVLILLGRLATFDTVNHLKLSFIHEVKLMLEFREQRRLRTTPRFKVMAYSVAVLGVL